MTETEIKKSETETQAEFENFKKVRTGNEPKKSLYYSLIKNIFMRQKEIHFWEMLKPRVLS